MPPKEKIRIEYNYRGRNRERGKGETVAETVIVASDSQSEGETTGWRQSGELLDAHRVLSGGQLWWLSDSCYSCL